MKVIASLLIFFCLITIPNCSAENLELVYDSTESHIRSLKEFNGSLYAGTITNGLIYRSSNGEDWELVYDSTESFIQSFESFNDSIYAGTNPNGLIYRSSNGVDWELANDTGETTIWALESFNGSIYAGTDLNGLIYRSSNGEDWELVYDSTESCIQSLVSFNGSIYAGTNPNGLIYRSSNGVDWELANDTGETTVYSLESFDGSIYAGTCENGLIYRSSDGVDWELVYDSTDVYILSLEAFNNFIYAGTISNGLIYRSSDGVDWELANDTTETGIFSLESFDGSIYAGTYPGGLIYRTIPLSKDISIDSYCQCPDTLFTNYTGLLSSSFLVNSTYSLNYSSIAYLMGMNYTLTGDYHSYMKVPANSIADEGLYRAHNRNTTPLMWWETNDIITEGNAWKWSGGTYEDHWIVSNPVNATHTYINVTGVASNVFLSTFYLGRQAMYSAPKTGIEINKGQGVIIKVWDLEQYRGRNNDYFVNLYFDTQLESTPDSSIDIWYCNGSFNPDTDDPENCQYCARMDTWSSDRWIDRDPFDPHTNVSYVKPLTASAADPPELPPDVIDYVYLTSNTVSSKSYILNATNTDPGICNLTFAQTNSMWLRNEVSGTNTPHAYTPSFFITFVRDYLEFTHHLYISNTAGEQVHSDYLTTPVGLSNFKPTYSRYNFFWWNTTTDYNMTGCYSEDFWINLTYGFDPDNGAELDHVLYLYDTDDNIVDTINSSLSGSNNDTDIFVQVTDYLSVGGSYYLGLLSTDNEGTTSLSISQTFSIEPIRVSTFAGTQSLLEDIPDAFRDTIDEFIRLLPFMIALAFFAFLIFIVIFITGSLKKW